jgi:hypothetical protein
MIQSVDDGKLLPHFQLSQKRTAMKSGIPTGSSSRKDISKWPGSVWLAIPAVALLGSLSLSGCSTSTPRPQIGPVLFTDVNGNPRPQAQKVIGVGESTYLSVNLSDGVDGLGADWSEYCGSAPPLGTPPPPGQTQDPSCGLFAPGHTMSGPVPIYLTTGTGYVTLYTAPAVPPKEGTVTLYASATADHSRTASVSLTILGVPIAVKFGSTPPSSLNSKATLQLTAVVSNDPTNAGVNWTAVCAASDWGSYSPAQTASGAATTYTAPAVGGAPVQIVATSVADPTRAVGFSINISSDTSSNAPRSKTGPWQDPLMGQLFVSAAALR